MWRQVYPEWAKKVSIDYPIQTRHYSEILAEQIKAGKCSFPEGTEPVTVTWHDSCHIGRVSGIYQPPRDVIQAIPGVRFVEMDHNRERPLLRQCPHAAERPAGGSRHRKGEAR